MEDRKQVKRYCWNICMKGTRSFSISGALVAILKNVRHCQTDFQKVQTQS